MEVIDSIGHSVKIYYTVRTAPSMPVIPSGYLLLYILPQRFDLLAPTLSSDEKTIRVNYAGLATGFTARIRAIAKTLWESDTRPLQTGVTPVFTLPLDWRTANRGADALINYTVYKSGSGERLMFSKVLRTQIGEVAPAIHENFDGKPTQLITVGQRIVLSSMTITFLSGNGQMGISDSLQYPPIPGKRSGQLLHLCYQVSTTQQRCRIDLKSAYSKVSFWQTWTNVATNTAFFYNTAGQLLGERTFTQSRADAHLVEFTSNGISRIEILCNTPDWIALDYFSFIP
ncbi:hypothetical protein [Pseudomonas sp. NPDC087614]|uniref:hypothetical protein n=1 Tax=Pseudomonas sp. NPDC087614 TaxID=3364442 RepID=UPI00382EA0CD